MLRALGDIGQHFPDNDDRYLGADSTELLRHVMELIREKGCRIGNLDATIIAQKPKLMPYLPSDEEKIGEGHGNQRRPAESQGHH